MDNPNQEARQFPFDYDAAGKGDYYGPGHFIDVFGCKPGTTKYQLKLLSALDEVQRNLEVRGKFYSVKIQRDGIYILTDPEAAEYEARLFEQRRRGLHRNHRRLLNVDAANLSDKEREAYDRRVYVQGATLRAIAAARKEVAPVACRRQTPGLPKAE